jgi:hypothetical protein
MSLIEDAKSIKHQPKSRKTYTEEDIELTLGWLTDEITLTQASKALHKNALSGNTLYYFAAVLKEAYRKGKIAIK